jgi:DNA-binding transcriptional MerR regulator
MPYAMSHLAERTGLAARTLRQYVALGLIPPPEGHGLGAVYQEEHMVRAIAIARMRDQGDSLAVIQETFAAWSLEQIREFVRETEPPPSAPPLAAEPAEVPAAPAPLPTALEKPELVEAASLPGARRYVVCSLLPGMLLMVDDDAPQLVRRVAAEIVEKYGTR